MLRDAVRTRGGKNWEQIALLVPGRTKVQCHNRWLNTLVSNIDPTTARTGIWTGDEDKMLREAVGAHGAKNWVTIATLVPGRTNTQCRIRWQDALDPISGANGRTGKWTGDEDKKLKDAVPAQGVKNWVIIAALVPGRTRHQCRHRWTEAVDPSISQANGGRTGKWKEDEDKMLKEAVRTHGGKNWANIAVLVPGRTHKQCYNRWHDVLHPSISRANGRTG
jgi:myb proto-oncogene protein